MTARLLRRGLLLALCVENKGGLIGSGCLPGFGRQWFQRWFLTILDKTRVDKTREFSGLMSGWPNFEGLLRRRRLLIPAFVALVSAGCAMSAQAGKSWSIVGPAGGDARAFAAVPGQPDHLYLGTTNSWVYESSDGGAILAPAGQAGPLGRVWCWTASWWTRPIRRRFMWARGRTPDGGGLWISHDGGQQLGGVARR